MDTKRGRKLRIDQKKKPEGGDKKKKPQAYQWKKRPALIVIERESGRQGSHKTGKRASLGALEIHQT